LPTIFRWPLGTISPSAPTLDMFRVSSSFKRVLRAQDTFKSDIQFADAGGAAMQTVFVEAGLLEHQDRVFHHRAIQAFDRLGV
ncbi:MAG: hypothetical protein OSB69_17955, partial [Alphaproteobacteria bacterium]|nr:hypothetical protein [Alphaproteobacteria bacterium]